MNPPTTVASSFAIITGTGFDRFTELVPDFAEESVSTPYGTVYVQRFTRSGTAFVHANRHAAHAPIARRRWRLPMYHDLSGGEHFLDPRPLIFALARFRPQRILSTTAVGTPQDLPIRGIVLPSDHCTPEFGILTFASEDSGPEFHQPKGRVFCGDLHPVLVEALHQRGHVTVANGLLRIIRGPGFESDVDAKKLRAEGVTIAGMHTALPEAYCSYELEYPYTSAAIITDSLAVHPDQDEIERIAREVGGALFETFCDLAVTGAFPPPSDARQKHSVPGLREKLGLP